MKRFIRHESVSEVLALLAEERELVTVLGEDVALHEHAARAAARVEHDARCGLEHGDERLDYAHRCEVLASALTLAARRTRR